MVKTELAALEAKAHKAETNGVDSVYTGELSSGKVDAKARKKDMIKRLEALFEAIERAFRDIRAAEATAIAETAAERP